MAFSSTNFGFMKLTLSLNIRLNFQAEIMGQIVTWVVPHSFAHDKPQNVDMRLMSIFVEFYTTMLGFVNFRLFHNLNLHYPPALVGMAHVGDDVQAAAGADNGDVEALKDRVTFLYSHNPITGHLIRPETSYYQTFY